MHCNNYLRLVSGLGFVRVSSRVRIRVKVRISVMIRVSIRTSWVVDFARFHCYRPVIWLLDNSWIRQLADCQLADWMTHRLDISQTRQPAGWTSRRLDNSRMPPATLRA